MDNGEVQFIYQDIDSKGNLIEMFYIGVGETTIGWPLYMTPRIMSKFKEGYKKATDIRYFRQQKELQDAIAISEELTTKKEA